MRPSSLRRDRQKQYNYMTQDEYEQELKKQIIEKRKLQEQEKMQNQQEILNHYKNYQLGADDGNGESALYMNDLDQLVKNREKEIEKFQMMNGGARADQNLVFQGDMNAYKQGPVANIVKIGGGEQQPFDKKNDLFSDNFVQNYQKNNIENLNIINSILGGGHTPGQGGNPGSQNSETERERRLKLREMERMKRQEGFQGGGYGQVEIPSQAPKNDIGTTRENIFGGENPNSQVSKRDLIWQQKMQQRAGSQEPTRGNVQPSQPSIQQQLPIFQNQAIGIQKEISPMDQFNNLRSSRPQAILHNARELDQSLNLKEQQQLLQQQQQQNNQPSVGVSNNPIFGNDDEVLKRRKENEKKMRQQEYQEFLAKQNGQQVTKPPQMVSPIVQSQVPSTQPSSAQSHQRPSQRSNIFDQPPPLPPSQPSQSEANALKAGGLNQLGLQSHKRDEEKLLKQREYKMQLDQQQQLKQQQQNVPLDRDRKRELSDQVFAEVLGSHSHMAPQQIMQNDGYQQQRNHSAVQGYDRKEQFLIKQQEDVGSGIFRNVSEDERKKQEFEKKKEYAQQLQQQMALKQAQQPGGSRGGRRGTSSHQTGSNEAPYGQGGAVIVNNIGQNKGVFEYQQMPQYGAMDQMAGGYQQQQMIMPQMMGMMPQQDQYFIGGLGNYQNPGFIQPEMGYQHPTMMPPQHQMLNQSPLNAGYPNNPSQFSQPPPSSELTEQQRQRLKQEEYRRQLEEQIKLKEEQKKAKDLEHQAFEIKQDQQFAMMNGQPIGNASAPLQHQPHRQNSQPVIDPYQLVQQPPIGFPQGMPNGFQMPQQQQPPGSQQNFVRQRTDVSKVTDSEQETQVKLKQMAYQEELHRQMEDKKRQKEEEKRKLKMEDEEFERRMQQEQEMKKNREIQELIKEDSKNPVLQEQKKGRQIRRDQFETSNENPVVVPGLQKKPQVADDPWQKALDMQNQQQQQQEYYQPSQNSKVDLPINNREDLFGNKPSFEPPTGFQGFQPASQPQSQLIMPSSDRFQSDYGAPQSMMGGYDHQQQQPGPSFGGLGSFPPSFRPPQGSSRLEDDYGQMILMYQKAFQEIIEFKNQYFEQALQMREKMIKEREELLEYERVKHQQSLEINNLKAVYNRLGDMIKTGNGPEQQQQQYMGQPYGNQQYSGMEQQQQFPQQLQSNLNNFLMQQKQDIARMSQSGGALGFKQGLNVPQHPQPSQMYGQPSPMQQRIQYPESTYIDNSNQHSNEKNFQLDQSLRADSKLIMVNTQNIINNSNNLFQTWKQDQIIQNFAIPQFQASQNQINQSLTQSLAGTSQFVNQMNGSTPSKGQQTIGKGTIGALTGGFHSRPQTSTQPPETIQELPNQEDDQLASSKTNPLKKELNIQEDNDFNSRESSEEGRKKNGTRKQSSNLLLERSESQNTMQQHVITNTNPLGNTTTIQENLYQIDKILGGGHSTMQKNQNALISPSSQNRNAAKTSEKFHPQQNPGATGSSFYNATMQYQRQQEQTQQEELQRQLQRIMGGGQGSIHQEDQSQSQNVDILRQMQEKPATPQVQLKNMAQSQMDDSYNYHIPLAGGTSSSQANYMVQQNQIYQQQRAPQVYVNPLQRASMTEKMQQMTLNSEEKDILLQSNINIADSCNGTQTIGPVLNLANQKFSSNGFSHNHNYQQHQYVEEEAIHYDEQNDEASEQKQNEDYDVQEVAMNERPKLYDSRVYMVAESSQQNDVWNDPDLIPPPVVILDDEDDENYFDPQINQSSQQYFNNNQSMFQDGDGTLKNLQMFSPPMEEGENEGINGFNLGTYEGDHSQEQMEQSSGSNLYNQQPPVNDQFIPRQQQQQQQLPFQYQTKQTEMKQQQLASPVREVKSTPRNNLQPPSNYFDQSEKSMSKKERDILELTKLIQKAKDTTNTLFENSDNFKFKKLAAQKQQDTISEQSKKNTHPQSANPNNTTQGGISTRKNIKTVDPFKQAEMKLQQQTKIESEYEFQQQQVQKPSKDNEILDNLDKMIQNLQDFKSKNGVNDESSRAMNRPFSGIPKQSIKEEQKSNKKMRPISAVDYDSNQQPVLGKYAQMALRGNESNKKSQKSLGKFASMALAGQQDAQDDIINEINQKYGGGGAASGLRLNYHNDQEQMSSQQQQQVILRPVSGKSNSNRYEGAQGSTKNRSTSKGKQQQQLFYDDESEDFGNAINSNRSGFNIGQIDEQQ